VIWRPGGSRTKLMLKMDRMKGPGEGKQFPVAIQELELGSFNRLGQPYKGAVVVPRALTGNEKVAQGLSEKFDDVGPANDDRDDDDDGAVPSHASVEATALRMLAAGKSQRQVADDKGLSKSAVGRLAKRSRAA
jgi:hypothetical protein